jgi:hypothetical protein
MTRALPLFLAEQIWFKTNARVQTLAPWVTGKSCGFVLSGAPWRDEDAATYQGQDPLAAAETSAPRTRERSSARNAQRGVRGLDISRPYSGCLAFPTDRQPTARKSGASGEIRTLKHMFLRQAAIPIRARWHLVHRGGFEPPRPTGVDRVTAGPFRPGSRTCANLAEGRRIERPSLITTWQIASLQVRLSYYANQGLH